MRILYNIIAILLVILLIPYFIVRTIREKGFLGRIIQSFGFLPKHALDKVADKNCIWIHASSVGEIVATSPIIKEFRKEFPGTPILVSVVTNTGYIMANRIIKDADSIIYFPIDLPWLPERMIKKIKPRVFLPVETELWPNFLKAARKHNVPVMMVNGRISDKSVKRYKYMFSILSDMIGTVKKFAMQSDIDASYIIRLGADEKLVTVTGNTKFDQTYTDVNPEEKQALLKELCLDNAKGIFLAGSTHKGEEEAVLKAFSKLKKTHVNAKLLIAPRSILRKDEIASICHKYGFKTDFRTKLKEKPSYDHDVVILDTIGELGRIYSLGDVIFVGGSLIRHGGHNILEPAAHGKAIIVGPHMFNFKDTHILFSKRNACITVKDAKELTNAVMDLFDNPEKRRQMEQETLNIIKDNKGASRRSAVILHQMLDEYEKVGPVQVRSTEKIENLQTYLYKLVHDESQKSVTEKAFLGMLYGFSLIYRGLVNFQLNLYQWGIKKQIKLDCFVISIGNITVGGTGKTPTAKLLARYIRDLGYNIAILNRGYRAKWKGEVGVVSDGNTVFMTADEAGDEAYLLARSLPDIPVLIGTDRTISGKYAVDNFNVDVVILDDGYQHWKLKRDLNILLVDAINVFGNGHMLPRGTLREPLNHLNRADMCLLTKVDQAAKGACEEIRSTLAKYNERALVVESTHKPLGFIEIGNLFSKEKNEILSIDTMRGHKIIAMSAIGNPASFEQTLSDIGAVITESLRFPDHHDYTEQEIREVMNQAEEQGAEAIVITDKDAVKIPQTLLSKKRPIPIYIISIEVTFINNAEVAFKFLRDKLPPKKGIKK